MKNSSRGFGIPVDFVFAHSRLFAVSTRAKRVQSPRMGRKHFAWFLLGFGFLLPGLALLGAFWALLFFQSRATENQWREILDQAASERIEFVRSFAPDPEREIPEPLRSSFERASWNASALVSTRPPTVLAAPPGTFAHFQDLVSRFETETRVDHTFRDSRGRWISFKTPAEGGLAVISVFDPRVPLEKLRSETKTWMFLTAHFILAFTSLAVTWAWVRHYGPRNRPCARA